MSSNRFFASFLALVLLASCDKAIKTFPLTIVTSENIGNKKTDKYPDIYSKLCNPIETDKDTKYNFSPYPILIKRLGIDNDGDIRLNIIADEKKSNTDNLNYRKNMITKFFQDSAIGDILALQTPPDFNKDVSISNYISSINKNAKIFYYYENPKNDEFYNQKIYDNYDSLISSIKTLLSENANTSIIVIINPESTNPPPPPCDTCDTGKPNIKTRLRQALLPVINTQLSRSERLKLADNVFEDYFSTDLSVDMYYNTTGISPHPFEPGFGKKYIEHLAEEKTIIDLQIINYGRNKTDNKISYLEILEKHKQ